MTLEARRRGLFARREDLRRLLPKYQAVQGTDQKDEVDKAEFQRTEKIRLSSLASTAKEINLITEALRLLDSGWDGSCLNCQEEICEARIRAVLHAQYCVPCIETHPNLQVSAGFTSTQENRFLPARRGGRRPLVRHY